MPQTNFVDIIINNEKVEIASQADLDLKINYVLEEPENWESKQSSTASSIALPATKKNDLAFNTMWNPEVEDLTPNQSFKDIRTARVDVNGSNTILQGYAQINSGSSTDKPEGYSINIVGGNGDWITNMQNLTLWDCVNTNTHPFTVATIEDSWLNFDVDEAHDFVYAPVRYRQPFGANDIEVNIYSLRPSLSIYWMVIRAFRQFGYSVNSQFFNDTAKFRRMVLPWTFGDFYDINSKITDGLAFKATGPINAPPTGSFAGYATSGGHIYFGGGVAPEPSVDPANTMWKPFGPNAGVATPVPAGVGYVFDRVQTSGGTPYYQNFRLPNTQPPNGFDNFGLYTFIQPTGTMRYSFNPPEPLASFIGSNVTLNFSLALIAQTFCSISGTHTTLFIEVTVNGVTRPLTEQFIELLATAGVTKGSLLYPTVHNFRVDNLNVGDLVDFRIIYDTDSILNNVIQIVSSGYVNVNPNDTGSSNWQYDHVTQQWGNIDGGKADPTWQPMTSFLQMTGLQIVLSNNVNLQFYDAFRNYDFLQMLGGLVDMFDLEIQTDPINKVVTIEPTYSTVWNDGTTVNGYFETGRVLEWTNKIDNNKPKVNQLFSNYERQVDFSFKQDGSDGGQNIFTARNKGLNINKVIKGRINQQGRIDNGLVAAIPGASRYMFNSNRFQQGNRQKSNRFFSACMHYKHEPWKVLSGVAPQLVTIFPENINDSSASAVTQTFEPKIAFYKVWDNSLSGFNNYGGFVWIGDPANPNVSTIRTIPVMFSVNYGYQGETDPVLSYSDQLINGVVANGLMKTFFLKRLAIMRNGQLYSPNMRLNLNDVCNWEHRESIRVFNSLYALIAIEEYNPIADESCKVTFWRIVNPEQVDIDNSYPSYNTITTNPVIITNPYDLKYAPLLLFYTDIPL